MRCKQQIHQFDLESQVIELRTSFGQEDRLQLSVTLEYMNTCLVREGKKNQCGVSQSCYWQFTELSRASSTNPVFVERDAETKRMEAALYRTY